jgi:hypothetical protein
MFSQTLSFERHLADIQVLKMVSNETSEVYQDV